MGKRIGRFGLVNYIDHPTNKRYKVFNFNSPVEAKYFEQELTKSTVPFEKDEETHKGEVLYLYAVDKKFLTKAERANYMVSANTRKKIIPNRILRYSLLLFFFAVMALAIIGYVKNS